MVGPSKQTYTDVCNEVTLVWGSLRLTPIKRVEDTTGIIHVIIAIATETIISTIALTLGVDISLN